MRLKHNVSLLGMKPEIVVGMMAAQEVCRELGVDLILTSVTDGKHSKGSRHYSGLAFDMRTRHMKDPKDAHRRLSEALGEQFDVVLESTHIHVEYDP